MPDPAYRYAATIVRWVDGDTCIVDIDLGMRITVRAPIRLMTLTGGINAAEHGTVAGAVAGARVQVIAPPGRRCTLHSRSLDRYGRVLGALVLDDGSDVGAVLVSEGLAVVWDGRGARPTPTGRPE